MCLLRVLTCSASIVPGRLLGKAWSHLSIFFCSVHMEIIQHVNRALRVKLVTALCWVSVIVSVGLVYFGLPCGHGWCILGLVSIWMVRGSLMLICILNYCFLWFFYLFFFFLFLLYSLISVNSLKLFFSSLHNCHMKDFFFPATAKQKRVDSFCSWPLLFFNLPLAVYVFRFPQKSVVSGISFEYMVNFQQAFYSSLCKQKISIYESVDMSAN